MFEEQLFTLAEVSVALAGFAGIIATFQSRRQTRASRGNALGLTTMVTMSLVVAAMSAVPIAASNFHFSNQTVWAFSSSVFALIYVVFLIYIRSRMINVKMKGANRLIIFVWWVFNFTIVAGLFLNVIETNAQLQHAVYFVALLNPLFFSGYMFVRLLLRPLWREVKAKEESATTIKERTEPSEGSLL